MGTESSNDLKQQKILTERKLIDLSLSYLELPTLAQQQILSELNKGYKEAAKLSQFLTDLHESDLSCMYQALAHHIGGWKQPSLPTGNLTSAEKLQDILVDMRVPDLLEVLAESKDFQVLAEDTSSDSNIVIKTLRNLGNPRAEADYARYMHYFQQNPDDVKKINEYFETLDSYSGILSNVKLPSTYKLNVALEEDSGNSRLTPKDKANRHTFMTGVGQAFTGLVLLTGVGLLTTTSILPASVDMEIITAAVAGSSALSLGVKSIKASGFVDKDNNNKKKDD